MQSLLFLYFDGLNHPVQLTGCDHLLDDFPVIFPQQDYHEGKCDDKPLISIVYEAGEYHFSASWIDKSVSYSDKADVLCDLIAKLAVARSFTDLETIYLHAAAVLINGKAVVFPSIYRSGKSFLTANLVAEGHRYIGDDVIPLSLESCKGYSAGFAPRMRLPLPETTDEKTRSFIEGHIALEGKRYAYLDLEPELQVPCTERIDMGAFVLLDRQQGVTAHLDELPVADVFQQLIKQNFAREIDSSRILSTLTQVVSNSQCLKLTYDRADEAVRLLTNHFMQWPAQDNALQFGTDIQDADATIPDDCLIRNRHVQKIRIEDENFLASPDGKKIYHLNQIGSGIWELLSEPTSKEEIISILETAFPGAERTVIEKDVKKILGKFQFTGLIEY